MTSATVWLPVLPPMLATMGISAASATMLVKSCLRTAPMTRDATKAVTRFSASQGHRLRTRLADGREQILRPAQARARQRLLLG